MRSTLRSACGFAAAIALVALPATAQTPGFTDVTLTAGISFAHANPEDTPGMPMHSGGSVGDFNNDGWPDIFLAGGGESSDALFINNGDGTFTNEATDWGLTDTYRGTGASAADFDKDGWMDIMVTNQGDVPGPSMNGQHKLYRNNGNGTFTEIANSAGVTTTDIVPNGYGATWGDIDLDGDLDLYLGGWRPSEIETSIGSRLFENNGDGTFTDITESSGFFDDELRGFGAIFADSDGDRYPEVFVAGDFGTSAYYINNRDGTFTQSIILDAGNGKVHNGMGTTIGDFNRDGKIDWFVTSIHPASDITAEPGNRIYMNEGNHQFRELPEASGVYDGGWGWGAAANDFNHDGWQDIMMTDGWPNPHPVTGESYLDEQAYLFINDGDETFTEVAEDWGIDHSLQGRGLMTLDYDRDGDMDIVILANNDEAKLYRNDLIGPDANWLSVRLDTTDHPGIAPHGLGAQVSIDSNGVRQIVRIHGGANFLSRSELVAHFGTAGQTTIDELIVQWPDGFKTVLRDVAVNQNLDISAILPMIQDPMVRGQDADITVRGLQPGESALILGSVSGEGEGPCKMFFGSLCADIVNPFVIGDAIADEMGIATLTVSVPADASTEVIYTQAFTRRGVDGLSSLKTNVAVGSLLDP